MAQIKQLQAAVSEAGSHFQIDKRLPVTQDDEIIAFALSEFLRSQGYYGTLATNGDIALDLIKPREHEVNKFNLFIDNLNVSK